MALGKYIIFLLVFFILIWILIVKSRSSPITLLKPLTLSNKSFLKAPKAPEITIKELFLAKEAL